MGKYSWEKRGITGPPTRSIGVVTQATNKTVLQRFSKYRGPSTKYLVAIVG